MKKKSKAPIIIIIVLIALGAGGMWLFKKNLDNIRSAIATPQEAVAFRGSIDSTVNGAGVIGIDQSLEIKIPSEIKVSEIMFSVGDRVSPGDILAVLDKGSITSAIVDVQSELDDVTDELKKTNLTDYQREEYENRQTELEDKKTLLLAYYENPILVSGFEGIISEIPTIETNNGTQGVDISSLDIRSLLPVSRDLSPRGETFVKAEGEEATPVIITEFPGFDDIVPVAGDSPESEMDGEEYDGVIFWTPLNDPFSYDTVYTANVVLTPAAGYCFDGNVLPEIDGCEVTGALESTTGCLMLEM